MDAADSLLIGLWMVGVVLLVAALLFLGKRERAVLRCCRCGDVRHCPLRRTATGK